MDTSMDMSWMIKLYDHRIKDITKWMVNQIHNMLMSLYIYQISSFSLSQSNIE